MSLELIGTPHPTKKPKKNQHRCITGYNFLPRVTYLYYFVTICLYIISNKANNEIRNYQPRVQQHFRYMLPVLESIANCWYYWSFAPTRVILSVEIFITTRNFFSKPIILQKPTSIYNDGEKNYMVKHWLHLICWLAQYASFHSICTGKEGKCRLPN